jgi:hypothetical protein
MWLRTGTIATPSTTDLGGDSGTWSYPDDGFDIDIFYSGGSAGGFLAHYLLLGGDDLEVEVGNFFMDSTSKAITGVGFQPDCVIFWQGDGAGTGNNTNVLQSLGVAVGTGTADQWALANFWSYLNGFEGGGGSHIWHRRVLYTGLCVARYYPLGPSLISGSLASFDSDGFTMSFTATDSSRQIFWMALRDSGGSFAAGTETQATSDTTKATSGLGFQPGALILASHADTALDTPATDSQHNVGFAVEQDGGTEHKFVSTVAENVSGADSGGTLRDDAVLRLKEPSGSGMDPVGTAVVDSWDSGGFTLDWSDTDGSARYFGYLAFEQTESGPGSEAKAAIFWTGREVTSLGDYISASNNYLHCLGFQTIPGSTKAVSGSALRASNGVNATANWSGYTDQSGGYLTGSFNIPSWYISDYTPIPTGFTPHIYRLVQS